MVDHATKNETAKITVAPYLGDTVNLTLAINYYTIYIMVHYNIQNNNFMVAQAHLLMLAFVL